LHEPTFQEQLAWSKEQLVAKDGKVAALMEENVALYEKMRS
jgi:hypothetical protein